MSVSVKTSAATNPIPPRCEEQKGRQIRFNAKRTARGLHVCQTEILCSGTLCLSVCACVVCSIDPAGWCDKLMLRARSPLSMETAGQWEVLEAYLFLKLHRIGTTRKELSSASSFLFYCGSMQNLKPARSAVSDWHWLINWCELVSK